MQVTVGNQLRIENPSEQLLTWCKKQLILPNPEYAKKVRMHFWVGNTPEKLYLFQWDGILVSGEYVNAPTRFPYVSLVEQDNYTTEAHMDSGDTERFATLMYEVNVYSDKAGGKKSVCRKIMRFVDDLMYAKNFRRTSLSPVPNLENATIYRLVARYKAETDGTTLYRR